MSHVIERAKSGRAKCRKCREKIEKDELRFGHQVVSDFGDALQWYHLMCAAEKVADDFSATLKDSSEEISNRDELLATIEKNRGKQKPKEFPYAELAPSGRSSCLVCTEKIAKDEPRVAVEREIDAGGFTRMGAGYLHPGCATKYEEIPNDLAAGLRKNSTSLSPEQLANVLGELE